MKKIIQSRNKLFDTTITITINEKLGPLEIKGLVARKLEQANASLKKMKGLPKV